MDVSDIFFPARGRRKARRGRRGRGGRFLLKIPGGGVSQAGGGGAGEGLGGCLWGISGGAKFFFGGPKFPPSGIITSNLCNSGAREGGRTLRKGVFLPSKHLPSAFYEMLPSKNPSKNLVFTEENPYRRRLRTLLRSSCC